MLKNTEVASAPFLQKQQEARKTAHNSKDSSVAKSFLITLNYSTKHQPSEMVCWHMYVPSRAHSRAILNQKTITNRGNDFTFPLIIVGANLH